MKDEIRPQAEDYEELLKEYIGWKINKETTDKILDHRGILKLKFEKDKDKDKDKE